MEKDKLKDLQAIAASILLLLIVALCVIFWPMPEPPEPPARTNSLELQVTVQPGKR